jgi:hypothetical protein
VVPVPHFFVPILLVVIVGSFSGLQLASLHR